MRNTKKSGKQILFHSSTFSTSMYVCTFSIFLGKYKGIKGGSRLQSLFFFVLTKLIKLMENKSKDTNTVVLFYFISQHYF